MRTVLSGYIWQQVSDFRDADVLLADLSGETEEVIGDREYDSNQIRQSFAGRNIAACIPPKKKRKSGLPYDWLHYKKCHMFAKLKDWRRVATRYDRCARTFMSAIHIAAYFIYYLKECVLSLGGLMAIRHDLALERIQILVWMARMEEWFMQEAAPAINSHSVKLRLTEKAIFVTEIFRYFVPMIEMTETGDWDTVNTHA
ncbi:hypothetical protein [Acetobacter aceti]|uniref:Transposase DDE domain-containing protein n=1 Tax=Acetobacter aceti TaxID=435 RepID=A0A6S6PW08_ACEAC|nr:hypothetical protein [Acetobacter aceti]BCI68822.1 hypothetical protein AAJCM20276_34460 [Acetobacter aceti]